MIKDIVSIYKEDKKEFIEGIVGGILIFTFIIFLFWFVGTFCYDF
jgi:hypothetical protein